MPSCVRYNAMAAGARAPSRVASNNMRCRGVTSRLYLLRAFRVTAYGVRSAARVLCLSLLHSMARGHGVLRSRGRYPQRLGALLNNVNIAPPRANKTWRASAEHAFFWNIFAKTTNASSERSLPRKTIDGYSACNENERSTRVESYLA